MPHSHSTSLEYKPKALTVRINKAVRSEGGRSRLSGRYFCRVAIGEQQHDTPHRMVADNVVEWNCILVFGYSKEKWLKIQMKDEKEKLIASTIIDLFKILDRPESRPKSVMLDDGTTVDIDLSFFPRRSSPKKSRMSPTSSQNSSRRSSQGSMLGSAEYNSPMTAEEQLAYTEVNKTVNLFSGMGAGCDGEKQSPVLIEIGSSSGPVHQKLLVDPHKNLFPTVNEPYQPSLWLEMAGKSKEEMAKQNQLDQQTVMGTMLEPSLWSDLAKTKHNRPSGGGSDQPEYSSPPPALYQQRPVITAPITPSSTTTESSSLSPPNTSPQANLSSPECTHPQQPYCHPPTPHYGHQPPMYPQPNSSGNYPNYPNVSPYPVYTSPSSSAENPYPSSEGPPPQLSGLGYPINSSASATFPRPSFPPSYPPSYQPTYQPNYPSPYTPNNYGTPPGYPGGMPNHPPPSNGYYNPYGQMPHHNMFGQFPPQQMQRGHVGGTQWGGENDHLRNDGSPSKCQSFDENAIKHRNINHNNHRGHSAKPNQTYNFK